jgi:hypothetical protein
LRGSAQRVGRVGNSRVVGNPETGLEEINRGLLEGDFWQSSGGLADRLLVRITYGMAIYQRLSAPTSLRDNFRVAEKISRYRTAIGL